MNPQSIFEILGYPSYYVVSFAVLLRILLINLTNLFVIRYEMFWSMAIQVVYSSTRTPRYPPPLVLFCEQSKHMLRDFKYDFLYLVIFLLNFFFDVSQVNSHSISNQVKTIFQCFMLGFKTSATYVIYLVYINTVCMITTPCLLFTPEW